MLVTRTCRDRLRAVLFLLTLSLLAPSAWAQPAAGWTFSTQLGGAGSVERVEGNPPKLHVQVDQPGSEMWALTLGFPCKPFEQGKTYRLLVRARASKPRVAALSAGKSAPPWSAVGLYRQLELTTEFKDFDLAFDATSSQDPARVYFDLGGHPGHVEIESLIVESNGETRTLFPTAPPKSPAPRPADKPPAAAPSSAKEKARTIEWEFVTMEVNAHCKVLGLGPAAFDIRVLGEGGDPGAVLIKRRMFLAGSLPTIEVTTAERLDLPYRIIRGEETREGVLILPKAGTHRLTCELGGLDPQGETEFVFLLGGQRLDWRFRE